MSVEAIIVDVGHVLVRGSLLNGMLVDRYPGLTPKVLYDPTVLRSASQKTIDRWVASTMTEKVNLLSPDPVSELIKASARTLPTPFAREFLSTAMDRGKDVICVGAIPEFLIAALLKRLGVEVQFIGTRVDIEDDYIVGVGPVLTPTRKKNEARKWMEQAGVDPVETVVIGDSLGDLEMMRLVPRKNRVAFNATEKAVLDLCERRYASSMEQLLEDIFNEQSVCK